ncbi:MAG: YjbQ family protein [Alphaproteobacteria bacterium]|nr:YjbQ family protein [Alphaproteobacteria bacterium]
MNQFQEMLHVRAPRQGLHDITGLVRSWTTNCRIGTGLLTLFIHHTSASLIIQENADPDVLRDLEDFFAGIAPESHVYRHNAEGDDDMPAHIRSALTQTQLSIPVTAGALALGTWQGLYLFEHRRRPQDRRITLHLVGG